MKNYLIILIAAISTPLALAQTNSTNVAGTNNTINAASLNVFIGAGQSNSVFGTNAGIVTGLQNALSNGVRNAFIGAGQANRVIGPVNFAFIGAGNGNVVTNNANNSAIVAGNGNVVGAFAQRSVIVGGLGNNIGSNNRSTTIVGGEANTVTASTNTSGSFAIAATIGGGATNVVGAEAQGATIAGGRVNTASGVDATVGGGFDNVASGSGATVPGGVNNEASGTNSFAAGTRAVASHDYSFVWGGDPTVDTESFGSGTYTARAPQGVRFITSSTNNITTNNTNPPLGVYLSAGETAWKTLSDSNAKTAVTPIDHRETLRKVAALPVTAWNYKQDPKRRYIGPMAQDFHAAFGLGADDKHISTLDTDGVTLSAIKGLVEELRDQDAVLAERQNKIDALEQAVEALRREVGSNLPPAE